MLKTLRNAHLKLKVTSSKCFFCLTNNPKPKDSSNTIINIKEKQAILKFKELKPGNIGDFLLEK